MAKISRRCYGKYGKPWGTFKCEDCMDLEMCKEETAIMSHDPSHAKIISTPKPELDPKWVENMITFMVGPQLAMLFGTSPSVAVELEKLIKQAVISLYEETEFTTTNDWVITSCNRAWELYNTFMTAKLIDQFDNGVPEKSKIIVAKNGSGIH